MEVESGGCLAVMCLPARESVSPYLRNLLNENLNSVDDLAHTPSLLARLQVELQRDDEEFREVQGRVLVTTADGVSYYDVLTKSLRKLAFEIENICSSNSDPCSIEKKNKFESVFPEGFGKRGDLTPEDLKPSRIQESEGACARNRKVTKSPDDFDDCIVSDRRQLVSELGALASEVFRVEKVRSYTESVLKLEQLVGDLEAVVARVSGSGRSSAQVGSATSSLRISRAVKTMQDTEKAVADIAHANWNHLVSAVDLRVDRVAAILRPAAIADHRAILTSIGWPPPLSTPAGGGKTANPFLEMAEDQERRYCQSFMALAILQSVRQSRRERQLNQYNVPIEEVSSTSLAHRGGMRKGRTITNRIPLWVVEELVSPLALKAEPHFLKWTTKPELAFTLVYRVAHDYVDVVDEVLQPLIDKARLAGYSAREDWVFSLVGMVVLYLQTHVLPGLANDLRDDGGAGSVAAALWLHIVDQALAFDDRMKSLASRPLGMFQDSSNEASQDDYFDNLSQPAALSITAIAGRPDWLAIWAKLEFEDVWDKLKADLQTDAAWAPRSKSPSSFGLVEGNFNGLNVGSVGEFRAPSGADSVMLSMSAVMDRCRNLSETYQQYGFIKDGAIPIAHEYLQELLRRCQESEAVTALAEEGSMLKVAICVNAARYCATTLQDWGEDIFFLGLLETQQKEDSEPLVDGSIFDEEVENFKLFRDEWLGKLVSSISRGFEARCKDYLRNRKRWSEVGKGTRDLELYSKSNVGDSEKLNFGQADIFDENYVNILKTFDVSVSLVDALAILQSQLSSLRAVFEDVNFLELWRNVALALDQLLMNSVALSGTKFSEDGGWQFAADVQALFLIFKPYCVRPHGFFKMLHDAVRLLTLPSEVTVVVLGLSGPSPPKFKDQTDVPIEKPEFIDSLRHYGVRKLAPLTAKRILNSRVLPKL